MDLKGYKRDILPLKDKLFRLALRILGNHADAQDAVQDVLIKTWQDRHQLKLVANVEAWIFRMTRNRSIDLIRARKKNNCEIEQAYGLASHQRSPLEKTESQDIQDRIRKVIAQLPEQQKMVIHLREIEGLTYQEIADVLDITMAQVKIIIFRGRKQLKKELINLHKYE